MTSPFAMPVRRRPFYDSRQLIATAWISSDLQMITAPIAHQWRWAQDLQQIDGDRPRIYRRLDLDWYGWLGARMAKAQHQAQAGTITALTWHISRARFAAVWEIARRHWSPSELQTAIAYSSDAYQPPRLRVA